jgi:hypothetical protein
MAVFLVELDATELHSDSICTVAISASANEEVIFEVKAGGEDVLGSFSLSVDEARNLRDFLNFTFK